MLRFLIVLFFIVTLSFSSSLESLLLKYQNSSKNSLETLDEKMGHVIIYTQDEIQKMQYQTLADILKELPLNTFSTNRYGLSNLSLAGTKTDITGFFKLYINDHEVSSIYNQSPSLSWLQMPTELINHVEIYYGEGSFDLGNETGIQFIRVYTKKGEKENGNALQVTTTNKNSNTQSFTHSSLLQNNWSYLIHATNQNRINDAKREYLFINLSNDTNNIDIGYTTLEKDSFQGYATDVEPNESKIESENIFLHMNNYFLDDKSLKTSFSYDRNTIEHYEHNDQLKSLQDLGLFLPPFFGGLPIVKYYEDLSFTKLNGSISKESKIKSHKLYTAINIQNKSYKTKERYNTNFLGITSQTGQFNDYNDETIYSFMLQDDYKLNEQIHLIGNYKIDKYDRDGSTLKDETQSLYRVGMIYLPTENFGLKTFYTKSYIPPTFYNIDFADKSNPTLKTQQYKYFVIDAAYTFENSKLNINYYNTHIDNFIYYTPVGFINVSDKIKTNGFIFDYEYTINKNHSLKFNYYISRLNQTINNSNKGGYIKYMGSYEKFDYFSSLIFRNGYSYLDVQVPNSYNLNLGLKYNYTKNLSFTLQGNNLLEKPTRSLTTDMSQGYTNRTNSSIEDYDRSITFGVRWLF
jgi:iron complex outermembrane receptor protein